MALFLLSPSARAEDCNPAILPADGANAYKNRGKYCEGLYRRLDSGARLTLFSLVAGAMPTKVADTMELRWVVPPGMPEKVRLTVLADPGNLHYRMDAVSVAAEKKFAWAGDVLKGLRVEPKKLSIIASAIGREGTYLPVSLGSDPTGQYVFRLRPSEEVLSVSHSLKRFDAQTNTWVQVGERKDLPEAARTANTPFPVSVDLAGQVPGLYRLDVSTTQQVGSSSSPCSLQVAFLHG